MKLKRCYIADFGKLHNFSYEFQDGLNTICQENGWGKTTFGTFIKAMFYGLEYNPRKKTADNERKKYFPWQGGNFGGSIEFTVGEKEYKLERYFGKKDKDDTFVLYDNKTGLISNDYGNNIGEELFFIDRVSYERSTYLPQNAVPVTMTDSINAKLSNLVENGNDINNYETAYSRLEEHLKEYKKTGGRGKLPLLREQIHAKQEEIDECASKAEGIGQINLRIEEELAKRQEKKAKWDELQAAVVREGEQKEQLAKVEHLNSLKRREAEIIAAKEPLDAVFCDNEKVEQLPVIENEIEELARIQSEYEQAGLSEDEEKQLGELDEFFASGCPGGMEIEVYLGENRDYDERREEIIRLQARLDLLLAQKQHEEEKYEAEKLRVQKEREEAESRAHSKAAKQQRLFLTIGILAIAAAVACFLWTPVACIPGALIGVVFVALAVTRKPKTVGETELTEDLAGAELENLQPELEALTQELEQKKKLQEETHEHYQQFIGQFPFLETTEGAVLVLTRLESKAAEYRRLSAREQEQREQKARLKETLAAKRADITEKLAAIHTAYSQMEQPREAFERLKADRAEHERLGQELEKSRQELREFAASNETMIQKLEEQDVDDSQEEALSLEELQQQSRQYEQEVEEADAKIHSYRKDLDALSVIADRQPELEEELEKLQNELAEAEYRAGILERTMQYLKEAKESFSTHYMGAMRRGFQKYAELLGGTAPEAVRLDVQLEAQVESQGALHGSEYFSAGNRDFIGICIRLALVEALFENEKPFLILDDPFVNLDDARIDNARTLLQEIAKEYQVVYLVCHSSRAS